MSNPHKDYTKGILLTLLCYFVWGLFPLYWKQLSSIEATVLLSHRVVWSFVFLVVLLYFSPKKKYLKVILEKKNWLWLIVTGILIGTNWLVYIYAVNSNQIVASSFGYYINPLMSVALAVIFLKEKLDKFQIVAIIFALVGVVIMSINIGGIPLISLVLALTFALYGLFRKIINLESMVALFMETFVLVPITLWWIIHTYNPVSSPFGNDLLITTLLILGGVVTAMPLMWFGKATTLIPLSIIGFMQYISPTLQLSIGVIVYKESFSFIHLISFGFVWIGLIIFSYSMYLKYKRNKSRRII